MNFSKNKLSILNTALFIVLSATFFLSFWLFSRYTVDDSFISWRYGRNLVEAGFWGYNTVSFDLTQAYTNPIYAFISIIPNILELDIVFFFKIFSLLTLVSFVLWFLKKTNRAWIMLLLLISLPATIQHVFSGLETFLFVFVLSAIIIALYENKKSLSIILTVILFFIRPESWLLLALVPLYFLIKQPSLVKVLGSRSLHLEIQKLEFSLTEGSKVLLCLLLPFASYLIFNYIYFDNVLPNTFYAKSAGGFNYLNFIYFTYCAIPLVIVGLAGRIKLMICLAALFFSMIVSYSTSELVMDYGSRFAFHIFTPLFIFCVYLAGKQENDVFFISENETFQNKIVIRKGMLIKTLLIPFYIIFLMKSSTNLGIQAVSYPRELDSVAALGKAIGEISHEDKIKAFSFGDAGMAAYHADIPALDNIGLASVTVARKGLDFALLDKYGIDLVIFHADASGIRFHQFNQQTIFNWAKLNNFEELCDIYTRSDYFYKVFSRKPIPKISAVCDSSKMKNNIDSRTYLVKNISIPPWHFWKE